MRRGSSLALLLALLALGCIEADDSPIAGSAPPADQAAAPAFPQAGSTFAGRASWYGATFQGRRTASGEIFDKEGLTAAHRSLPFGTLLRVTCVDTGGTVVVRVNDRGPFVADRVIDLSEAAARLIGLLPEGTGEVRCLVLPPEESLAFGSPGPRSPSGNAAGAASPSRARSCRIQIASYRDPANAAATLDRLRLSGIVAAIEIAGEYRRIVLAAVPEAEVVALVERLKALGYRSLLMTWSDG
jgi:rare lipoprotein A